MWEEDLRRVILLYNKRSGESLVLAESRQILESNCLQTSEGCSGGGGVGGGGGGGG